MTAISATLQKPAPQPDREVGSSPREADGSNPPAAGARGGFADALRAAVDRPAGSRADESGAGDEPDDEATGKGGTAQAGQDIQAPPPSTVDPTNAAAILATILNAAASPVPAAGASPAAAGSSAGGVTEGGTPALRSDASAPASTAGAGSLAQGGPDLGLTNAPLPAAQRTEGNEPASTSTVSLPKVAVLGSAVHFKPVLPKAAREPTVSAPAASAPVPAGASLAESPPVPAGLPGLIGAEPRPGLAGLPTPAAGATPGVPVPNLPRNQPQPTSAVADAAARAAGAGLDKADVTALADIRAVTGAARAALANAGRAEDASSVGPEGLAGASPGLPAGTLPTIAETIRTELDRAGGPEAAAWASRADQAVPAAPDGPLRVLRIQLKPDDLGTVTVELRLANGQLETHLRASQPETAALLHRDAAILGDLLKQANYPAQVTVTQARPSDTGGFSGNAPSQGQPGGFSDGGARQGQGGDRQRQAEPGPAAGRREGERRDETTRPRDGGVYL